MNPSAIRSPWARLAFFALALMWAISGWLILLDGGFTKTYRHSSRSVRVGGEAGVLMAYIFFALSAIAVSILLKSLGTHRLWVLSATAIVMAAPALYLFLN